MLRYNRGELPPTAGLPLLWRDFVRSPVRPLAQGLTEKFGLPAPVLTCSGTAALVVALHALRQWVPEGERRREVIVPAYTCPLVPLAVNLVPGLRAVPCDTAPGSIDFDQEKLSSLCSGATLAVIPTHLGGRVADVAAAKRVASQHGAAVLEDAAQSLGAAVAGKSVGLSGDAAFFSLAAGKGLTTYEGGMVCAKEPELGARLALTASRLLRPNPYLTLRRNVELLGYTLFYTPPGLALVYGRNLRRRLDQGDEEAAVGDRFSLADIPLHDLDLFRQSVAANALERLPKFLRDNAARAMKRLAILRELEGVSILSDRPGTEGTWPFLMVLMPGQQQRDKALARLWRSGFGVTKLFVKALPDYAFLAPCFGKNQGACPNARAMANTMLTITNTHWLDEQGFATIAAELKESV